MQIKITSGKLLGINDVSDVLNKINYINDLEDQRSFTINDIDNLK